MKKLIRLLVIGLTGSLAIIASPAIAQWYGGVTVGSSHKSTDDQNVVTGATAYSFTNDTRSTGYKLQAGYQIHESFAVEGGYVNLGKFRATENVTAPVVGSITGNYKADGWNLVGIGILPLSQGFSAYGKLGTIYSTFSNDIGTTGGVVLAAGSSANRKRTEWNWTYGLGVQYDITKTLAIRGEWERFDKLGDKGATNPTGEFNINLYSVGLNFKF